MKKKSVGLILPLILFIYQIVAAAQFESLTKGFNRAVSHVMIRKIAQPTAANLDFAAYTANPIRFDPDTFSPKAPPKKVKPADCSFVGLLSCQNGTIKATPLTIEEQTAAMAWEALQKKAWEIVKTDALAKIGSAINSYKWADPSVSSAYQEISSAYIHGSGDSAQLWVRVEFKPWVTFTEGMADEFGDGFKAVYGKLNLNAIDKKQLVQTFSWIRSEYCKKILTRDEVVDWANVLASYWYPKFNTDIVDMTGQLQWPNDQTEEDIVKELNGAVVKNPVVVIRGNPLGAVLYNVFAVDFPKTKPVVAAAAAPDLVTASVKADTGRSQNSVGNDARFTMEIKQYGDYGAWARNFAPFRKSLTDTIAKIPASVMGFKGKDDWVFFRKDIECLNSGDLSAQASDKNPLPRLVEFKHFLEKSNTTLLFVAIPDKSEVYFDKLPGQAPADASAMINPFFRKFLKDAQDSGIEVVDLLPLFLAAKQDDAKYKECVYQKQDTHWTVRGLEIAAEAIASRIKQYGWYTQVAKKPVQYALKDTVFSRQGDIVDKLAEADRASYPPVMLRAKQVFMPDGTLYKPSNPQAPIMLIGDSFTGVFELVDCKGAGVGARIAEKTKTPVDIITSWGGGPQVREKMLRARKKDLPVKRLVVYMMVERDLYNYSGGWAPLP